MKSVNIYRKSKSLPSHPSLTGYINQISSGGTFPESTNTKLCKFYIYHRATESYIGKAGTPVEHTRTARVDECKPVMHIFNLIKDGIAKYLKHRTYADNCSSVLPLMKDSCTGKFIDVMSSFGVKNILRKDIATHDVFFNNSAEIADYLSSINLHYYYTTVPVEDLVKTHHGDHSPIEIPGCMKQHLILFNPKKDRFCKEYLCDCASCLQFQFNDYINKSVSSKEDLEADVSTEEIFDEEADQSEQNFYFVTVPSFISLLSGNSVEPLCFVRLISKDCAEMDILDTFLLKVNVIFRITI